jgi:hypothetical protein
MCRCLECTWREMYFYTVLGLGKKMGIKTRFSLKKSALLPFDLNCQEITPKNCGFSSMCSLL